jgi:hypothetical protein
VPIVPWTAGFLHRIVFVDVSWMFIGRFSWDFGKQSEIFAVLSGKILVGTGVSRDVKDGLSDLYWISEKRQMEKNMSMEYRCKEVSTITFGL